MHTKSTIIISVETSTLHYVDALGGYPSSGGKEALLECIVLRILMHGYVCVSATIACYYIFKNV